MVNKIVFYVPKIAPSKLLLKLSGLWSIYSEVDPWKLSFLGRLLELHLHECNLSATILFKFVDSYLIAFKFAQWRSIIEKESGR